MSTPFKSQLELYNVFIAALQDAAAELTDTSEGSEIDKLGGSFSLGGAELTKIIVDQFNKTFFSLANGPEITGNDDDLQTLAVDQFGDDFIRPPASKMTDVFTFFRPNADYGVLLIPLGTVVKTGADANGNVYRYVTDEDCTLTNGGAHDLNVSVGITAVVAGAASNAGAAAIGYIESTILDQSVYGYNVGSSNGTDAQDDAVYRETIRNLIESLAGATAKAIAAKAKTVAGVVTATAIEQMLPVKQWDIGTSLTVGDVFYIPVPVLYIGDSSGMASVALINAVKAAIDLVRACGVLIQVVSAVSFTVDWAASYTLNPSGPNYTVLVDDPSMIIESMKAYINAIPVGTGFVRADANAALLAIWGASGTNDLTAFSTSDPSGDISAVTTSKMIAGNVSIV